MKRRLGLRKLAGCAALTSGLFLGGLAGLAYVGGGPAYADGDGLSEKESNKRERKIQERRASLVGLVSALQRYEVEAAEGKVIADPNTVFMQLYTKDAVTLDGRKITRDQSYLPEALASGGFEQEKIDFIMRNFENLAFVVVGTKYAAVTGELLKELNSGKRDPRLLASYQPSLEIATLSPQQADLVYEFFYRNVDHVRSSLMNLENIAEVSAPVVDNKMEFDGQIEDIISLLAFRPFDPGNLRDSVTKHLGLDEYLMKSWEDARSKGYIQIEKPAKMKVSLAQANSARVLKFAVVESGKTVYTAEPYVIPLHDVWKTSGGRPEGTLDFRNVHAAYTQKLKLAAAPAGKGGMQDSIQVTGSPRDSLRNNHEPEVNYPNGTFHPSEENAFDIGLGVSSLGIPQASAVFWLNRRLGLSIGAGFGGNAQDEKSWEESVSGTNDNVKRSYTSKGSPGVLEALMGVEGRYKGLRYGVQAGVEKRRGDYQLRVDEERRDKNGVLKGKGSSEKTELQESLKPDIRAGIGWVHDGRFGINGFVGRVGRPNKYYGGAKIIIGVY